MPVAKVGLVCAVMELPQRKKKINLETQVNHHNPILVDFVVNTLKQCCLGCLVEMQILIGQVWVGPESLHFYQAPGNDHVAG